MKSAKKILYLFLALLLPGLLFVFLKFFGKNEFDIPVYFGQGVAVPVEGCPLMYPAPYLLPDSTLKNVGWDGSKVTLFVVREETISKNLKRIKEEFNGEFTLLPLDTVQQKTKACAFVLRDTSNIIVVDKERRVRGYYNLLNRKDTDRLSLELNILLKKY